MSTRALDTTTPIHLDPAGVAKYYNSPLTQNLSLLDIVALHNAELHVSKEILTEHEGFQTRIKTFETELNQIVEALLGQHIGAPEEWPQYVVDWKNSWSEFVRDCGEGEDICRRVRVSLKELLTKIQANQSKEGKKRKSPEKLIRESAPFFMIEGAKYTEPGRYRDHVLRYQTNLIHDLPPRYSTLLKEELVQNAHDLSSWHEAYRAVRVLAALRGKSPPGHLDSKLYLLKNFVQRMNVWKPEEAHALEHSLRTADEAALLRSHAQNSLAAASSEVGHRARQIYRLSF